MKPRVVRERLVYRTMRLRGKKMPRKEKRIERPELMSAKIMRARKNFSKPETMGPREEMAPVSSASAGEETFVPTISMWLGITDAMLLRPDLVSIDKCRVVGEGDVFAYYSPRTRIQSSQ